MGTCSFFFFITKELNLVSDVDDRSVVVVKVYQKHRIGEDEMVGSFTDTISKIFGSLKDGGTELKLFFVWC